MKILGQHPESGLTIYANRSPFGPYLQCGDATESNRTPTGCWLPKNLDITDVDLNDAVEYLSFPRILGMHPETNVEIRLCLERGGPCIRGEAIVHGEQRPCVTRIPDGQDVMSVSLDRAIELMDEIGRRGKIDSNGNDEIRCEHDGCDCLATHHVSPATRHFCTLHSQEFEDSKLG